MVNSSIFIYFSSQLILKSPKTMKKEKFFFFYDKNLIFFDEIFEIFFTVNIVLMKLCSYRKKILKSKYVVIKKNKIKI